MCFIPFFWQNLVIRRRTALPEWFFIDCAHTTTDMSDSPREDQRDHHSSASTTSSRHQHQQPQLSSSTGGTYDGGIRQTRDLEEEQRMIVVVGGGGGSSSTGNNHNHNQMKMMKKKRRQTTRKKMNNNNNNNNNVSKKHDKNNGIFKIFCASIFSFYLLVRTATNDYRSSNDNNAGRTEEEEIDWKDDEDEEVVCAYCLSHDFDADTSEIIRRVRPANVLRRIVTLIRTQSIQAATSENLTRISSLTNLSNQARLVRPCACKTPVHVGCLNRWRWQKWRHLGHIERRCRVCAQPFDLRVLEEPGSEPHTPTTRARRHRVRRAARAVGTYALGIFVVCSRTWLRA